jgi:hypothetical protein
MALSLAEMVDRGLDSFDDLILVVHFSIFFALISVKDDDQLTPLSASIQLKMG